MLINKNIIIMFYTKLLQLLKILPEDGYKFQSADSFNNIFCSPNFKRAACFHAQ